MRRARPQPIRDKIDLSDPAQMRAWSKRLGITPIIFSVWSAKWAIPSLPSARKSSFERLPHRSSPLRRRFKLTLLRCPRLKSW